MIRSTTSPRNFSPFLHPGNLTPGWGGMMDWANISDDFLGGKFLVKLNGAIAIGADQMTVDALTDPLLAGQILRAAEVATVLVHLTANKAIGQVSLAVTALTAPIPAGTVLDFGAGKQAKTTALAAAAAVVIAVEALDTALVNGDEATYQGGENNIEVLKDAKVGDVTVYIGNAQFALADDSLLFGNARNASGLSKFVPQAQIMARHSVTKNLIPRKDALNGETAIGFLVSDANQFSKTDAKSGYGIVVGGTPILENLCPDADSSGDIPTLYKTEMVANGCLFQYLDYTDDTNDDQP